MFMNSLQTRHLPYFHPSVRFISRLNLVGM